MSIRMSRGVVSIRLIDNFSFRRINQCGRRDGLRQNQCFRFTPVQQVGNIVENRDY